MPLMETDDHVRIHYEVDDFRDPWLPQTDSAILMSHGFARNMKWFQQWVPTLARRHKVIRYDIRGCGGVNAPPPKGAEWTAERMARDVLNLMDHLGVRRIHWVSFESGGIWGMVFARLFPDRIMSLSTCNTPSAAWTQGRMPSAIGEQGLVSEVIARKGLRQWLIETSSNRLGPGMSDERLVSWHVDEQSKTPNEVAIAIEHIVETIDLADASSKVNVPVLLLVGDRSPNCPLEEQVQLQRAFANARLLVLPDAGAGIQLQHAESCARAVLSFIDSL